MLCHHLIMELKAYTKKFPTLQAKTMASTVIFFNISLWCCILLVCSRIFFLANSFVPLPYMDFSVCVMFSSAHKSYAIWKWHVVSEPKNCQKADEMEEKSPGVHEKRKYFRKQKARGKKYYFIHEKEKNWIIKFCVKKMENVRELFFLRLPHCSHPSSESAMKMSCFFLSLAKSCIWYMFCSL